MGKGRIKITRNLIERALNFPVDWKIEDVYYDSYDGITFVISGNDFPKVTKQGSVKDCEIIVHKENIRFEVKPIV